MEQTPVTRARLEELTRFIPIFNEPDYRPVGENAGGQRRTDGSFTAPYPIYREEVTEFFRLAGQPCWADHDYVPGDAARMLEDEARLAVSTLDECRGMLTYCVRGERFSDGHWAQLIESGRLVALLHRLETLATTLGTEG